jgi:hypothetical protein
VTQKCGDAKNVVDAMNYGDANWSRIGHLVEDAKILLNTFTHFEVNFVGREANFAAHDFPKLVARLGIERKWLGEILVCISEIIRVEQFVPSL